MSPGFVPGGGSAGKAAISSPVFHTVKIEGMANKVAAIAAAVAGKAPADCFDEGQKQNPGHHYGVHGGSKTINVAGKVTVFGGEMNKNKAKTVIQCASCRLMARLG